MTMNSSWVHCEARHSEISVADQISMAPSDAIFGTFLIALIDISHADWGHRRPASASGARQEAKLEPPDKQLYRERQMLEKRSLLATVLFAFTAATPAVAAEMPGVNATEIKIGNTNPHSGPASAYSVFAKLRPAPASPTRSINLDLKGESDECVPTS
jgi:hypothetical protein